MTDANTFFQHVYGIYEDEQSLTLSGFGNKRQTKSSNSKTPVDTSPQIKDAKQMTDDKSAKGFERNNRPNDHRPSSVDFPKTPYSPSNPQQRFVDRWTKAGLEQSTREAQR